MYLTSFSKTVKESVVGQNGTVRINVLRLYVFQIQQSVPESWLKTGTSKKVWKTNLKKEKISCLHLNKQGSIGKRKLYPLIKCNFRCS